VLETMNLKHLNRRPLSQHNPLTPGATRTAVLKRRSTRMALHASIGLTGEDRQKATFTMTAKATNLNKHGAAVQLNRELLVGSVLTVKNQRGTQVSARVVAQIAALQGISTYAIEFVEHDENAKNFWGITFPSNGNS
jgi:hypothetical protein